MTNYAWVVNFANSIVGVGVLAMPFCFQQCGIVLAALLITVSAVLTKKTCEFLLRTASYTRKSTFEQIAYHVYGPMGKLVTEISIIGLLLGTLVAFQVVLGDLAPSIVHHFLSFQETWSLRTILMVLSSGAILPLCFLRISSLSSLNAVSMSFYMFFIFIIVSFSIPNFLKFTWVNEVNFWQTSAFFHCLPIILIAFNCQTQVFVVYNALPDPNMKTMSDIINKAINMVAIIYITVGTFGYLAFYNAGIHGDILANFPKGFFTQLLKLGFLGSVIVSFPLMVFPLRVSINSLLYSNKEKGVLHDVISNASDYISPERFMYITLSLVSGTLVVGILVPQIELVLSITGALVGTFLCLVFPSILFLVGCPKEGMRRLAKGILIVGTFSMIVSTMTVLSTMHSTNTKPHSLDIAHSLDGDHSLDVDHNIDVENSEKLHVKQAKIDNILDEVPVKNDQLNPPKNLLKQNLDQKVVKADIPVKYATEVITEKNENNPVNLPTDPIMTNKLGVNNIVEKPVEPPVSKNLPEVKAEVIVEKKEVIVETEDLKKDKDENKVVSHKDEIKVDNDDRNEKEVVKVQEIESIKVEKKEIIERVEKQIDLVEPAVDSKKFEVVKENVVSNKQDVLPTTLLLKDVSVQQQKEEKIEQLPALKALVTNASLNKIAIVGREILSSSNVESPK